MGTIVCVLRSYNNENIYHDIGTTSMNGKYIILIMYNTTVQ